MTTATAVPLESLAQQIARQQSELEALRQEYQSRQACLADLKNRKEELEKQLRKLDDEIHAVDGGRVSVRQPVPAMSFPTKSTAATPPAKARRPKTLSARLVRLVQEANNPLTVKQLADEVVRRKFPTSSQNIPRLIQTRVRELVAKGILQHAPGQSGYVVRKSASTGKASAAKPVIDRASSKNGAVHSKKRLSKGVNGRPQKPLRVILNDLLAKSRRPLGARELADQAKAQGYHSESKDFVQVIWVALANMENVANVPGKGYRLKKR